MQFGKALRGARERAGIGSRELARRTGIPPASISNMETGKKAPTVDIMRRLSKAFDEHTLARLELVRAADLAESEQIRGAWITDVLARAGEKPVETQSEHWFGMSGDELAVTYTVIRDGAPYSSPWDARLMQVYADITCGWGSEVDGQPKTEPFPVHMVNGADHAVTVKGDSMRDLGFLPGTYLFIKSQPTADNGQPVIARLDGETYTCKVYRDSGRRQWLEPIAGTVKDRIYLDQHDVEILGAVVATWWRP